MSERSDADVLREAAEVLETAVAAGTELPVEARQRLNAAVVRLFATDAERGQGVPPFSADRSEAPSATEIMIAVTEFLAATEIELFELGMWQTWGGVSAASKGESADGNA